MYIIGKANKSEIKEIKKLGFGIEKVNMKHFDLAMGGNGKDIMPDEEFIAIYLDCDVVQECRTVIALENLVKTVREN